MKQIKIGKHIVDITHPEKILFPKNKIRKEALVSYYHEIAPTILKYIKNRPISMRRFPEGITKEGFYQKEAGTYFPDYIKRFSIKKQDGGTVNYVVCNNAATIVYLANQGVIEIHPWLSRIDKINYPDRIIFDLDPSPGVTFAMVQWVAGAIQELLQELEVPHFIMTTGSRGFHIVIPLKRTHTFDAVRDTAQDIGKILCDRHPDKCTMEIRKSKRGKRIFIDTLRNAFGQTGIAPYAVRAKSGAPVATPLEWDEAFKKDMKPDKYTIKNIFRRLSQKEDPWHDIDAHATNLNHVIKNLEKLNSRSSCY